MRSGMGADDLCATNPLRVRHLRSLAVLFKGVLWDLVAPLEG